MKIPKLNQHQRDLMQMGKCPFCEQTIKGWKAPVGSFAPEMWATLDEQGIDPANGHADLCLHKSIWLS
jgi:hypothetical protein